jgi:hypothetical protein
MKGIMAKESSLHEQGVPSFQYCAADRRFPKLFELSRPLDDLKQMLPTEFAGKTLTTRDIYMKHNIGRRYIERNYKDTLMQLGILRCHHHRPASIQAAQRYVRGRSARDVSEKRGLADRRAVEH